MKKSYLVIAFLLSFVVMSCSDNTELIPDDSKNFETSLEAKNKLVTPKGVLIASSVKELKEKISPQIVDEIGNKVGFTITEISYLDASKQSGAIISYKDANGLESNIAIFKALGSDKGDTGVLNYPVEGGGKTYTAKCIKTGSCDCRVSGTSDGSTITFSCSCNPCELVVKESV